MTHRELQKSQFLATIGWEGAQRSFLAGDASNRKYDRILHPTLGKAVLMDAPKERGEDTQPFLQICEHLRSLGLSAPQVYGSDTNLGFVLLEDLGDDLFSAVVAKDPAIELQLYQSAINALAILHNGTIPAAIPNYGVSEMVPAACLVFEWYDQKQDPDAGRDAVYAALQALNWDTQVPVLRDYHAQNLLWLPERAGVAQVGLLDFQDAARGHPVYDIASLLNDARRDVSDATKSQILADLAVQDPDFSQAFATLSAQRNMRILGVFARLSLRDKKPHYLDLMQRVWDHLQNDLSHPSLSHLKEALSKLQPPTKAHLESLRP